MKEEFYSFIKVLVEKLISNMYEKDNNTVVIKHYNTFEIKQEHAKQLEEDYCQCGVTVFYKTFQGDEMVDAYEPFLGIIKSMYQKYYSNESIGEFFNSFEIYSLQKSIISSYLATSRCERAEELILNEVEYEKEVLLKTIVNILIKISNEHPMIICINHLNGAAKATIEVLKKLLDTKDNGRIIIVATYNDLRKVLPHVNEVWEQYIKRLEILRCIADASLFQTTLSQENGGVFLFDAKNINDYIIKLNNMFHTLEFDQASYYLNIIYKKLEMERLSIKDEDRFEIIKIYARISIYSEDMANALLLCNSLNKICKIHNSFEMNYEYNYLFGLTQVYNVKLSMAKRCADICYELARANQEEFLMFKATMLKHMASMSGWHNILFCANDIPIDEKILKAAEKYQYYNYLAHTYIYAFDNEVNWFEDIETIEKKIEHFQKGIEIAKKMGNEFLTTVGYRKNIMLSSINGAFEVTTYYYGKLQEVVGDSDPFKAADIYKGLGYNLCATEKYEQANKYYNKAINIYYKLKMMDFVGETLYNMSLNCILAGEYETAYDYLQVCIQIVDELHLNNLRVCNISKLFGLLAVCSYELGLYYNCQMYIDNTMQFLSHKLNSSDEDTEDIDPSYTVCDDDLFLYYYARGLMKMHKGEWEKALNSLNNAEIYVIRSVGNHFFSYVQYRMAKAQVYRQLHDEYHAVRELNDALEYAKRTNAKEKERIINAVLNNEELPDRKYDLKLEDITLEKIRMATEQASINKDYKEIKKQMDFIGVWQKIVDITGKEKGELISNALNSFILNFSIDSIVYIDYSEEKPGVYFQNMKLELTEEKLEVLTRYFDNHRTGFVASKMRKDYQEYREVVSVFGVNEVCSMIAIPFYVNEKLDSLFICYIMMKDNWNSPINKYLLDENDFNVYSLVLRQLVNAIDMLEKQKEINEINIQLKNAAVTDYLTSLLNRDGFFGNVRKQIVKAKKAKRKLDLTVLYIDLDNFKFYNDTFGHDVGDLVLKEIANILKEEAKGCGFAARFGGDEFLMILEHADSGLAMKKARDVLQNILSRDAFVKEIKEFLGKEDIEIPSEKKVSCSIGVAPVSDVKDDNDIGKAIKYADHALYGIKHSTKCDCKLADIKEIL
ncbi:MAG: GGDEF domain-containing protein [Lachnospiraceae bacterium]|nr:GGDEF domain-containing protein [Lachnospiraceae bacterium]